MADKICVPTQTPLPQGPKTKVACSTLSLHEVLDVYNHSCSRNIALSDLLKAVAVWLEDSDEHIHNLLKFSGITNPNKAYTKNGFKS